MGAQYSVLVEVDPVELGRLVRFAEAVDGGSALLSFGESELLAYSDPAGDGHIAGVMRVPARVQGSHPPIRVEFEHLDEIHDHVQTMSAERMRFRQRGARAALGADEVVLAGGDHTPVYIAVRSDELVCGVVTVSVETVSKRLLQRPPPLEPPAGITLDGQWVDGVMPLSDEEIWRTTLVVDGTMIASRNADSEQELTIPDVGLQLFVVECRAVRAVYGWFRYFAPMTVTADGHLYVDGCLVKPTPPELVAHPWSPKGQVGRWVGPLQRRLLVGERVPINTASADLFAEGGEGSVEPRLLIGMDNATALGTHISVIADQRAARFEAVNRDGSRQAIVLPVQPSIRLDELETTTERAQRPNLRIVGPFDASSG